MVIEAWATIAGRVFAGAALSAAVVAILTGVALGLTVIANRYEVRGLGWVGLGTWLIVVASAILASRRSLPVPLTLVLVPIWFVAALLLYQTVGYHALGWTGLVKGP